MLPSARGLLLLLLAAAAAGGASARRAEQPLGGGGEGVTLIPIVRQHAAALEEHVGTVEVVHSEVDGEDGTHTHFSYILNVGEGDARVRVALSELPPGAAAGLRTGATVRVSGIASPDGELTVTAVTAGAPPELPSADPDSGSEAIPSARKLRQVLWPSRLPRPPPSATQLPELPPPPPPTTPSPSPLPVPSPTPPQQTPTQQQAPSNPWQLQPLRALGQVSALVVSVTLCGVSPPASIDDLRATLDGSYPATPATGYLTGASNTAPGQRRWTVSDQVSRCSGGRSDVSGWTFVEAPVVLSASDTRGACSACSTSALQSSITDAVYRKLAAMGYGASERARYDRVLMYMPEPAGGCAFAGLATFGCVIGYPCNIWMLSTAVHVTVHELMHNYGLAHANAYGGYRSGRWVEDTYGDRACTMGNDPFVCFNAPNAWRLGWADPVATLGAAQLPVGSPTTVELPLALSSTRNFARIEVSTWAGSREHDVFLSYRAPDGDADQLLPGVYIHTMGCDDDDHPVLDDLTGSLNGCETNNTGVLADGGVWVDAALQLRVAVLGMSGGVARVQVCRSDAPCAGEPGTMLTLPSKWYGYPVFQFADPEQGTPVGFWDDAALFRAGASPISRIRAYGFGGMLAGITTTYGRGANERSATHGDDPSAYHSQRHEVVLRDGEKVVRIVVRSRSVTLYQLQFVTDQGRTLELGNCDEAACRNAPQQVVVPPEYAPPGAYLAAPAGIASRLYENAPTRGFLNDLTFWWAAPNPGGRGGTAPAPTPGTDSTTPAPTPVPAPVPVPVPVPSGGNYVLTGGSYAWERPYGGGGSQRVDDAGLFDRSGRLTSLSLVVQAYSSIVQGALLVGLQAAYGDGDNAATWGMSPAEASRTSGFRVVNVGLADGEAVRTIDVKSVGGRAFGNPFDWLEGAVVTTTTGRKVAAGCLEAAFPGCFMQPEITAVVPPSGAAVVGHMFGEYVMLDTRGSNTPYVISHLGWKWAVPTAK